MTRVTMIGPAVEDRLLCAFECMKETVEEFTDSYYTSHEAREKIVQLSDILRDDFQNMLILGQNLVSKPIGTEKSFFLVTFKCLVSFEFHFYASELSPPYFEYWKFVKTNAQ